jgi:hypothetical protein
MGESLTKEMVQISLHKTLIFLVHIPTKKCSEAVLLAVMSYLKQLLIHFRRFRFDCVLPFLLALQGAILRNGTKRKRAMLHTFILRIMQDLVRSGPKRLKRYVEAVTNARLMSNPPQVDLRLQFAGRYWRRLKQSKKYIVDSKKVTWLFQKAKIGRTIGVETEVLSRGIREVLNRVRNEYEEVMDTTIVEPRETIDVDLNYFASGSSKDEKGNKSDDGLDRSRSECSKKRLTALNLIQSINYEWRGVI